jgi:dTDP-4-dehydrorhamnose 3,5-epimerase
MDPSVAQCNASFNARAGTLRGMHHQREPHGEPKLVRCVRGAIFDVCVDLRRESQTYRRWFGAELTADNGRMLFIPAGMAHGFQTLADETEVLYQMGARYAPDAAASCSIRPKRAFGRCGAARCEPAATPPGFC